MNNPPILTCLGLSKTYHDGSNDVSVLKRIDFKLEKGARVAVVGPSGSGKSTFLHLLGGLDKPSSGTVCLDGVDWSGLSEKKRCQMRNEKLGFIYQFHHLLPEFTALENVAMPLLLANMPVAQAKVQAQEILTHVGLAKRLTHKPSQLSGGERQRVAIARALVHRPHCLLADEPTGNLDQTTAAVVFDLMLSLNETLDTALVIVTHDMKLAEKMDTVFTISEGLIV